MNTEAVILIAVGVVVVAGIAVWAYFRNRSQKLQQRFGPEYGRTVREMGGRIRAEEALEKREKRIERLQIRQLPAADQRRFAQEWREVQARFVDDPRLSLTEADNLVGELMKRRGYPMAEFEQRAADISVDHPLVVDNYRAAHTVALRHERGEANTEDMRQAMVHYRTLFEELMGTGETATTGVRR
jgi:hypothetical protein